MLTTNVDQCFQKSGFDKQRLFCTQGDYGLFQCSEPCHQETYDNEEAVKNMVLSQGFQIEEGKLIKPENTTVKMKIPEELIPRCPKCGKPMSMNLRADNTFVEDEGWHREAEKYQLFLQRHEDLKVLFIELGVVFSCPITESVFFLILYYTDLFCACKDFSLFDEKFPLYFQIF